MKEDIYKEIICKGFCRYYKDGRDELYCGGYKVLRENVTINELRTIDNFLKKDSHVFKNLRDLKKELEEMVCNGCDFFVDGCDFVSSESDHPCGGYLIISKIIQPYNY